MTNDPNNPSHQAEPGKGTGGSRVIPSVESSCVVSTNLPHTHSKWGANEWKALKEKENYTFTSAELYYKRIYSHSTLVIAFNAAVCHHMCFKVSPCKHQSAITSVLPVIIAAVFKVYQHESVIGGVVPVWERQDVPWNSKTRKSEDIGPSDEEHRAEAANAKPANPGEPAEALYHEWY